MEISPIQPTTSASKITREQFEQIKTILGAECLLIAADTKKHDCDMTKCTGHVIAFRCDGFTDQQLNGMSESLWHSSKEVALSHQTIDY